MEIKNREDEYIMKNIIKIKDKFLKEVILEKLGRSEGEVTKEEMKNIRKLEYCWHHEDAIKDLTGLEYAKNLRKLKFNGNRIKDITPLKNLNKLKVLDISSNRIEDFTALGNITSLAKANIIYNPTKKFFLPNMNNTKVDYSSYVFQLPYTDEMTSEELCNLEKLLYNPTKEQAEEVLRKDPRTLIFSRALLSEEEIENIFKDVLSDIISRLYIEYFLYVSPYGYKTEDFMIKYGGVDVKRFILEKDLKHDLDNEDSFWD